MKKLFKNNIYPKKREIKIATQEYLAKKHKGFFESFNDSSWTSFYENNIKQSVSLVINFDNSDLLCIINILFK